MDTTTETFELDVIQRSHELPVVEAREQFVAPIPERTREPRAHGKTEALLGCIRECTAKAPPDDLTQDAFADATLQ